jgi:hypothetical protein
MNVFNGNLAPMLSPVCSLVESRGIGDINRSGGLAGRRVATDYCEAGGMRFDSLIDVVAVEGDDDG